MDKLPDELTVNAWVLLHRAQRRMLDETGKSLKANDLPGLDWYDVLLELRRAGADGLRQYEIGDRVLLSKYNLSRLIDRLESQDLLRRDSVTEDGRGNRITITKAGEAVLKKMWPIYGKSIQQALGDKLSEKELASLTRILGKLL